MLIHFTVDSASVRGEYLGAAARLRKLSRNALLHLVVDKMLDDQLILAIMDDGDRRYPSSQARRDRLKLQERLDAFNRLKEDEKRQLQGTQVDG